MERIIPIIVISAACYWTFRARSRSKAWLRVAIAFIIALAIQFAYLSWLHSAMFPETLLSPGLKSATENFPSCPIKEVIEVRSYENGVFIKFVTNEESKWHLTYNKDLDFKNNPKIYKTFTIWKNAPGIMNIANVLKIGSKEEAELLELLHDFKQRNLSKENSTALNTISEILKEKHFERQKDLLSDQSCAEIQLALPLN